MGQWVSGEIVSVKRWNDRLISTTVSCKLDNFVPGQFVKIRVNEISRCYSIVKINHSLDRFEILFNIVEHGEMTPQLSSLAVGSKIEVFDKPNGIMTIENINGNENLWLIATGTGIGPFVSFVNSCMTFAKFDNIIVVHGVRYVDDLTYRGSFIHSSGNVVYIPCTSRVNNHGYRVGRVTEIISDEKFNDILVPEKSSVAICGRKEMIDDVKDILKQKNFNIPGENVVYEKYF